MATATVDQAANAATAAPVEDITKNNVTYVVVREVKSNQPIKDAEGKPVLDNEGKQVLGTVFGDWKSVPEDEEVDKEIAAGELEEKGRQTFTIPDVNTIQGCRNLVPDDEEFVNIFSAGLNQKMKNRARTAPLTKDFQFTPGSVDLTSIANEKSGRQRLTPIEKLTRDLEKMFPGFTAEQRQALINQASAMAAGK